MRLFFLATFVFSWTIYGILSIIRIENQTTLSRWLLIAAYGPSLVAILISGFLTPHASHSRKLSFKAVFALTFAAAAAVECLDHWWWNHRIDKGLVVADLILVSMVALVLSGVRFPRQGVRELLSGMARWQLNAGWYLLAIGLWPAIVVGGNAIAQAVGLGVPNKPWCPSVPLAPLVVESFFWYLLFGGPLNEEAGWRGFAQARLQQSFNPLGAAVIIGALWGLWHIPLHLMGFYPMGAVGAVIRVFSIPLAVIFAWLFNRTGQSLLPVLCLHSARNTTSLFLPRNFVVTELLMLLIAGGVALKAKMWRPLKSSGPM
ncbi:MAG: CPBP family intramembrane glutamic endopeptidase [Bryobacteraceae bacterium]